MNGEKLISLKDVNDKVKLIRLEYSYRLHGATSSRNSNNVKITISNYLLINGGQNLLFPIDEKDICDYSGFGPQVRSRHTDNQDKLAKYFYKNRSVPVDGAERIILTNMNNVEPKQFRTMCQQFINKRENTHEQIYSNDDVQVYICKKYNGYKHGKYIPANVNSGKVKIYDNSNWLKIPRLSNEITISKFKRIFAKNLKLDNERLVWKSSKEFKEHLNINIKWEDDMKVVNGIGEDDRSNIQTYSSMYDTSDLRQCDDKIVELSDSDHKLLKPHLYSDLDLPRDNPMKDSEANITQDKDILKFDTSIHNIIDNISKSKLAFIMHTKSFSQWGIDCIVGKTYLLNDGISNNIDSNKLTHKFFQNNHKSIYLNAREDRRSNIYAWDYTFDNNGVIIVKKKKNTGKVIDILESSQKYINGLNDKYVLYDVTEDYTLWKMVKYNPDHSGWGASANMKMEKVMLVQDVIGANLELDHRSTQTLVTNKTNEILELAKNRYGNNKTKSKEMEDSMLDTNVIKIKSYDESLDGDSKVVYIPLAGIEKSDGALELTASDAEGTIKISIDMEKIDEKYRGLYESDYNTHEIDFGPDYDLENNLEVSFEKSVLYIKAEKKKKHSRKIEL